jgi:hypothetical protein
VLHPISTMNTNISSRVMKSVAVALLLGVSATLVHAGPPEGFWNRAKPVTTTKEAKEVKPEDTVVMACGACKTVLIRESRFVGPPSKGRLDWFTVGSKHECGHCGGEITVVRGKTADAMQHNCSMCGEGAAFCGAVSAKKK